MMAFYDNLVMRSQDTIKKGMNCYAVNNKAVY